LTRKLVVFNDHSWTSPQFRSKRRPVQGNASLAEKCLLPETADGKRQISLLQNDGTTSWSLPRRVRQNFGMGMRREILEGYYFLAHTYMPGDEIYLIGAGRGAFALQCLAQMISAAGLLHVNSLDNIKKAYIYSHLTSAAQNGPSGQALKNCFQSKDVPIHFLGCWDTVGSAGVPTRGLRNLSILWSEFLSDNISTNIQVACHALALDDNNPAFAPHIWTGLNAETTTRVEQVWFAGKHQNVTGGQRDSRLSDIAFRWLINKAITEDLHFDAQLIDDLSTPDVMGCLAETSPWDNILRRVGHGKKLRTIGMAETHLSRSQISGTEKIHYTVLEKDKKDVSYTPKAYEILPPGSISIALDEDMIHKSNRRYDRIAVNCPATLLVDQSRYNGNVLDFSEGGARIWLRLDVPVGTEVTLRSSVLTDEEHHGHVVWTKDQAVGVAFQDALDLSKIHMPEGTRLQ